MSFDRGGSSSNTNETFIVSGNIGKYLQSGEAVEWAGTPGLLATAYCALNREMTIIALFISVLIYIGIRGRHIRMLGEPYISMGEWFFVALPFIGPLAIVLLYIWISRGLKFVITRQHIIVIMRRPYLLFLLLKAVKEESEREIAISSDIRVFDPKLAIVRCGLGGIGAIDLRKARRTKSVKIISQSGHVEDYSKLIEAPNCDANKLELKDYKHSQIVRGIFIGIRSLWEFGFTFDVIYGLDDVMNIWIVLRKCLLQEISPTRTNLFKPFDRSN
jgi:hypothetical protein